MNKLKKILRITAVVAIFACVGLAATHSIVNPPKTLSGQAAQLKSLI